jgi:hypothetical protein
VIADAMRAPSEKRPTSATSASFTRKIRLEKVVTHMKSPDGTSGRPNRSMARKSVGLNCRPSCSRR